MIYQNCLVITTYQLDYQLHVDLKSAIDLPHAMQLEQLYFPRQISPKCIQPKCDRLNRKYPLEKYSNYSGYHAWLKIDLNILLRENKRNVYAHRAQTSNTH